MSMRLSEIHPATVHFPLVLLPAALAFDIVGRATRDRELCDVGRWSIIGAAIATAIAGVFGLISQEEVVLDEHGKRVLKTHRTLNVGLLAAMTAMALVRARRKRPSLGYLIAGVGAFAVAAVSAYFGGELVYDHGAGVKQTRGRSETDHELATHNAIRIATQAAKDLGYAMKHAVEDVKRGDILPVFTPPRGA